MKITEEDSDSLLQVDATSTVQDQFVQEAMLALEALGYSKRELAKVEKTLNKINMTQLMKLLRQVFN